MKHRSAVVLLALSCGTLGAQPRRINVGDAEINYDVAGRDGGQAIVFVHGWAQDLKVWADQMVAFSGRYRVILYDLRGFGESTGFADLTADPDDLRILLDSLGIRRAHVVGLSRGAQVALSFAAAFPDRVSALVLEGCSPPVDFQPMPEGPRPVELFGQIARAHGLDSLGKFVLASPLAWMPPEKPELRQQLRQSWTRYRGRDVLNPRPPSGRVPQARMAQLRTLRVPTLIVNGDHEMPLLLVVADTLARRIPNSRKLVIGNAGHGAHMAQPAPFNRALQDFFQGIRR